MQQTAAQFNELVKNRRSVFPDQFIAGKEVPKEIIEQILTNASWAPNHGQSEPWRFSVFSGEGLKKFAAFQSELYKQSAGDNFTQKKYEKLQRTPLLASHIISLGMKRTTTKHIPEIEDIEAVACAAENIYLSLAAYDLGGYWTSGGITYLPEAKYFFELGEEDKLLGFFYIGYVATPSAPAKRKSLEEKVKWIDK
ncbi:MAG: nitroreductase [Ferruginibacter sp.]